MIKSIFFGLLIFFSISTNGHAQSNERSKSANQCVEFKQGFLSNNCNVDIWVQWWWKDNVNSTCRTSLCALPVKANTKETISQSKGNTVFAACKSPHKPWSYNPIKGDNRFYCARKSDSGESYTATNNARKKAPRVTESKACSQSWPISDYDKYYLNNGKRYCGTNNQQWWLNSNEFNYNKRGCDRPFGKSISELSRIYNDFCRTY